MVRIVAGIAVLGMIPLVVATASSGCTSTSAPYATDCTNYTPDAGVGNDTTCAIGWSCDDGNALYQMTCTQSSLPEYYECSCSNGNDTTITQNIRVDAFLCSPQGAINTANMGCLFNIQP
jgi:hypothetical protein